MEDEILNKDIQHRPLPPGKGEQGWTYCINLHAYSNSYVSKQGTSFGRFNNHCSTWCMDGNTGCASQ